MRRQLFVLLEGDRANRRAAAWVEIGVNTLILINVSAVVLESFAPLAARFGGAFRIVELVSVGIFTVEYVLRLSVSDLRYPELSKPAAVLKYALTPLALVDLAAILPFYLPLLVHLDLRAIRVLRLVRIVRILKLRALLGPFMIMETAVAKRQAELSITVFLTAITVMFSAMLMYFIEAPHQPEAFSNVLSSIWWSIATLTTVGYGDIYPVTALGRVLAAIIALAGIGLVALPTGILGSSFIEEFNASRSQAARRRRKCSGREPQIVSRHLRPRRPRRSRRSQAADREVAGRPSERKADAN